MSKKKKMVVIAVAALIAIIAAVLFYQTRMNYSGEDINRYVGKWEMLELRSDGNLVNYGSPEMYAVIGKDRSILKHGYFGSITGTLKYGEKGYYHRELDTEGTGYQPETGYISYLEIKNGKLIITRINEENPELYVSTMTYKKIKQD